MQFTTYSATELKQGEGFKYVLEKAEPLEGYMVHLPYRDIYWVGETPEEAIGQMLRGVAKLARDGSIDPDDPARMGCPPIQHAMNLLMGALAGQLERRRGRIDYANRNIIPGASVRPPAEGQEESKKVMDLGPPSNPILDTEFHRDNEIIAALGTAISALARVKEL